MTDIAPGGLKDPTDKPEPLVGEDRKSKSPVEAVKAVVRKSTKATTRVAETATGAAETPKDEAQRFTQDQRVEAGVETKLSHEGKPSSEAGVAEGHGAQAVIDNAAGTAIAAKDATPKDQEISAEAVDQGHVVKAKDVQRAELDAAKHADKLQRIEDKVGPHNLGVGIRVAGDKEGDHAKNVEKVADAAADDDGPKNAAVVLDEDDRVDSPHGRTAEANSPYQAAKWAPHGDMNRPAVSFGPEGSGAIYGPANPAARDQLRGLEGDSDADVKREAKRSKGAANIDDERTEENRKAKRIGKDTTDTVESQRGR